MLSHGVVQGLGKEKEPCEVQNIKLRALIQEMVIVVNTSNKLN